jgi:CRISPR-associated exonuclease Cas4
MAFPEDEIILISALNQYAFCPRRCALMYVEGTFVHNQYTLLGTLEHEGADTPGYEVRQGVKVLRALPLSSERLGLSGKADWVEMRDGIPYLVEMKHGPRRVFENDDIQICAQALCLEEAMEVECPKGAVYHIQSRHRREVVFNASLRELTEKTVVEVRNLIRNRIVPKAHLMPKCEGCSLRGVCMPEMENNRVREARIKIFEPAPWT